jgi:hypothetical protein
MCHLFIAMILWFHLQGRIGRGDRLQCHLPNATLIGLNMPLHFDGTILDSNLQPNSTNADVKAGGA